MGRSERGGVSAVAASALLAALALVATGALGGGDRTELAAAGGGEVRLADLVAQSPLWAPETVAPVSDGFTAWMYTLPFG